MRYRATFPSKERTEAFAQAVDDPNSYVDVPMRVVEFDFPYWMERELRARVEHVFEGDLEVVPPERPV